MRTGERYNKVPRENIPCLRCDKLFKTWDRRQNRLCPTCTRTVSGPPRERGRLPKLASGEEV